MVYLPPAKRSKEPPPVSRARVFWRNVALAVWVLLTYPIAPLAATGHPVWAAVFASCFILLPCVGISLVLAKYGNSRGRWFAAILSLTLLTLCVTGVIWVSIVAPRP